MNIPSGVVPADALAIYPPTPRDLYSPGSIFVDILESLAISNTNELEKPDATMQPGRYGLVTRERPSQVLGVVDTPYGKTLEQWSALQATGKVRIDTEVVGSRV